MIIWSKYDEYMHIYIYRHLNDVCYFYICYLVYSGVTILPCVVYTYTYNYIHNDISQMYIYNYIYMWKCECWIRQSYVCGPAVVEWWPGAWTSWLLGTAAGWNPMKIRSFRNKWRTWIYIYIHIYITIYNWDICGIYMWNIYCNPMKMDYSR